VGTGVAVQVTDARSAARPPGWALFGYGFRPFFLLAALYAPTAVAAWLLVLMGVLPDQAYMGGPLLHGHEMVFGFALAGVLGFLTTALPNFAGATPLTGRPLALLAAVWLLGRLALWAADWLPPALVTAADLALVPLALALLLRSLPRHPNRRMLLFPALLAIFAVANALAHAESLGWTADTGIVGVTLGINLIALLVAIIGGRIIPSFTANALRAAGSPLLPRSFRALDATAIGATAAVAVAMLAVGDGPMVGAVALLAGLANAARLSLWRGAQTVRSPILIVLHVGYGWLAAAHLLRAAAELGGFLPASAALHALTIGCFGTMMLAVMSRAALGHTGRAIRAHPLTVAAYALVAAAALFRLAAALLPDLQMALLSAAAVGWIAAFALFVVIYAPILLSPRMDGKPG
jgi:uncharacterized protein involved in response to NO